MTKKGQFDLARKTIYWTIAGGVLIGVVMAFAIILTGFTGKITAIPPKLDAELVSLRFLTQEDCLASSQGSISFHKFTSEQLQQCYQNEDINGMQFQITLVQAGKTIASSKYYHAPHFKITRPVIVENEGVFTADTAVIEVQT